jgi:rubrerythrin
MEDLEDEDRQLVEQIRRDDERHAQMLRERIEQMVREGGLR